jgi:hypothetical protein
MQRPIRPVVFKPTVAGFAAIASGKQRACSLLENFSLSGRIADIRDNTPFLSFDPDIFQWTVDKILELELRKNRLACLRGPRGCTSVEAAEGIDLGKEKCS